MATANLNPLVDAFAVAVWFPMSRRLRKTLSLGRTEDFSPSVGSSFGGAIKGPKARCVAYISRGRSGRTTAHRITEILKP